MDKVSVYAIREKEVVSIISGMVGKDSFVGEIGKLNDVEFSGDSHISEAIVPTSVGYGDGMSIIISDFLTDNDYENAINHMADKKRDVFCIQVLSPDELNPKIRGKVHLYDSENVERQYRKNINRDIAKAYNEALEFTMNRIKNYCNSRDANYLLVQSEKSVSEIFLKTLPEMGVFK